MAGLPAKRGLGTGDVPSRWASGAITRCRGGRDRRTDTCLAPPFESGSAARPVLTPIPVARPLASGVWRRRLTFDGPRSSLQMQGSADHIKPEDRPDLERLEPSTCRLPLTLHVRAWNLPAVKWS